MATLRNTGDNLYIRYYWFLVSHLEVDFWKYWLVSSTHFKQILYPRHQCLTDLLWPCLRLHVPIIHIISQWPHYRFTIDTLLLSQVYFPISLTQFPTVALPSQMMGCTFCRISVIPPPAMLGQVPFTLALMVDATSRGLVITVLWDKSALLGSWGRATGQNSTSVALGSVSPGWPGSCIVWLSTEQLYHWRSVRGVDPGGCRASLLQRPQPQAYKPLTLSIYNQTEKPSNLPPTLKHTMIFGKQPPTHC